MNISIVIPNYNGEEIVQKNIPHVLEACRYFKEKTAHDIEIIFVDDFSTDLSITVIESLIEKNKKTLVPIRLLKNDKNYGFSTTVNKGVNASDAKFVVLLNTDVRPEKDFLLPLLTHFSDEKVFAVGCMDKSIEHGEEVLRGRGIGWYRRGLLMHRAGRLDKNSTLWVSGGSSMYRKSVWDMLGGMNEIYNPFYWEDIDISYRAQKYGYKVLFEKESVVTHEHEKGAILSKYSKRQVEEFAFRNQIIFSWLNSTDRQLLFQHVLWLPYHVINAVIKGNRSFLSGLLKAFVLFPTILKFRKKQHKKIARSDHSLQLYS